MHRVNRRFLPAFVAAGFLALGAAWAGAAEPTQQDLQAQIQQLQAKVAELEMKQAKAADVDATVAAIIRDADRHSQLMAVEGFTAGYSADRGFVIQSADRDFLLHPYLQWQFRYVGNYSEETEDDDGDDDYSFEDGFEVRRMKFGFDGNLFGPNLTYAFQWATSRSDGVPELEDAWMRYKFADMWALRVGQFKDPLAHESQVSANRQLAADRSVLTNLLAGNDNYVQGLGLIYDSGERFRAEAAFTDGFNSQNTAWEDSAFHFGVAGRGEYMILGDPETGWRQYQDFSAIGAKTDLLVAGAGFDWSEADGGNVITHTVDLQWEPEAVRALSVYGAYIGRYTDVFDNGNAYSWGYEVQAGYLLNAYWEPFVRLDYTRLDDEEFAAAAIEDDIYELGAGVNYYFKGHNAKLTADVVYLPNGSPIGVGGLGIVAQDDDDAQFVGRIQFQLVL